MELSHLEKVLQEEIKLLSGEVHTTRRGKPRSTMALTVYTPNEFARATIKREKREIPR